MYNIDLNFGRTRQVDAYNGMTISDFAIIAKNNFDVVLDDEVLHQKPNTCQTFSIITTCGMTV